MDRSFSWPNSDDAEAKTTPGESQTLILTRLNLAILASSPAKCQELRSHVEETGLARVPAAITTGILNPGGRPFQRLVAARPAAVVVDLTEPKHALASLGVLNEALPEATLLLCCPTDDPDFLLSALRAGAQEFIPRPVSGGEMHEALKRIVRSQTRTPTDSDGKVISVLSPKGGAGATCVSINLAYGLSKLPKTHVALVDLDRPMGDIAGYLGLSSPFTILDALSDTHRLDKVLLDSYMVNRDGVAVLPGLRDQRLGLVPSVEGLSGLFDVLRSSYSFTVADLSSTSDEKHLEALVRLSSDVVVVMTPELPCLWRTDWLLQLLSGFGAEEKLRLIVNRSHRNDEIREKDVTKAVRHPVYWSLPNDYGTVIESINRGQPLISMGVSALADSYTELTHKLAGMELKTRRPTLISLFSF